MGRAAIHPHRPLPASASAARLQVTREIAMSLGYTEPEDDAAADTTIAQPAYLAILAEFERADGPLRAGQLCQILDVGTEPKHREGMRSRLKRLAARGILTETEPGLFTLVAKTEPAQQP
ncbi:hypothetical protein GCM10011579_008630 [Streptomyces albiflavescens]|uniref:Uncharacterized protein n=1 Tax=Streptomyces albiflavescens TaxID=1623582 RepID=A0A917XSL0_9ACTN|nr:hypothetical protein [Streptomyces albiflavescens]GGN52056.1 hypothetical protein GCM10011579_008630 [Streptomyces albiflavescens]